MVRRHVRFLGTLLGGVALAVILIVAMATSIAERTEAHDATFERNKAERAAFFDGNNALVPFLDTAVPTFFEESSDGTTISFFWTNTATQETRRVTVRTSSVAFRFDEGSSVPRAMFTLRSQLESGTRSYFDRQYWEAEIVGVTIVGRQEELLRRIRSAVATTD